MGFLKNGSWVDRWYDTKSHKGEFLREDSVFRKWITKKGGAHQAESNRYHLYISLACPWAHRTIIYRTIKNLKNIISVSIVNPFMLENGWTFKPYPGSTVDHLYDSKYLYELYLRANKNYSGRVTVPILWDKKLETIVNNESSEIIRMFNSEFNQITNNFDDYYPDSRRKEIDKLNHFTYHNINNAVYKAGFASSKEAYEDAYENLFKALDKLEQILESRKYLLGEEITETDWRVFPTLIRFDAIYYSHFKCNKKRIIDYPNLHRLIKDLYNFKSVKETVDTDQSKIHYFGSHKLLNPSGIIPKGPKSLF